MFSKKEQQKGNTCNIDLTTMRRNPMYLCNINGVNKQFTMKELLTQIMYNAGYNDIILVNKLLNEYFDIDYMGIVTQTSRNFITITNDYAISIPNYDNIFSNFVLFISFVESIIDYADVVNDKYNYLLTQYLEV